MNYDFVERIHIKHECPIHYWISRDIKANNKWIVFLHGAGLDHRMFAKQFNELNDHYNIFMWDARGHGKSRPIGLNITIDLLISDLIEILDDEQIETASFIGHSMGAHLAQEIRFRYPKRMSKLIMIGGMSITRKRTRGDKISTLKGTLTLKLYPWEQLITQNKMLGSIKKVVQDYIEEAYRTIGKTDYIKIMREDLKVFHHETRYLVNIPTLFLAGEYDRTIKLDQESYYWLKIEKYCHFHIIPNAAHNANQDNPTRVNALIFDFLKSNI